VPVRIEPPPIPGAEGEFVPERIRTEPDVTPCAFAATARRQQMGSSGRSSMTGFARSSHDIKGHGGS